MSGKPGTNFFSCTILLILTGIIVAVGFACRSEKDQPSGSKASAQGTLADSLTSETEPRIPIQVAMQRIAQAPETPRFASRINSDLPGAQLYAQKCVGCHGNFGEGKRLRVLSVAPYRYEISASLAGSRAEWTRSQQKFADIVLRGVPGRAMPGDGTLTPQQMADLFTFVRSLQVP